MLSLTVFVWPRNLKFWMKSGVITKDIRCKSPLKSLKCARPIGICLRMGLSFVCGRSDWWMVGEATDLSGLLGFSNTSLFCRLQASPSTRTLGKNMLMTSGCILINTWNVFLQKQAVAAQASGIDMNTHGKPQRAKGSVPRLRKVPRVVHRPYAEGASNSVRVWLRLAGRLAELERQAQHDGMHAESVQFLQQRLQRCPHYYEGATTAEAQRQAASLVLQEHASRLHTWRSRLREDNKEIFRWVRTKRSCPCLNIFDDELDQNDPASADSQGALWKLRKLWRRVWDQQGLEGMEPEAYLHEFAEAVGYTMGPMWSFLWFPIMVIGSLKRITCFTSFVKDGVHSGGINGDLANVMMLWSFNDRDLVSWARSHASRAGVHEVGCLTGAFVSPAWYDRMTHAEEVTPCPFCQQALVSDDGKSAVGFDHMVWQCPAWLRRPPVPANLITRRLGWGDVNVLKHMAEVRRRMLDVRWGRGGGGASAA